MSAIYETSHDPHDLLPVHRHSDAYLTLVVDGAYTEFGPDGPVRCELGTLVLHPPFHLHGDRFDRHRVRTLNLPLPGLSPSLVMAMRRVADPRKARALLQRHPSAWGALWEAADAAVEPRSLSGWQPMFIARLLAGDADAAAIATDIGISPEHVSRTLARTHGLGPRALRAEWRFRRALVGLAGDGSIASVAMDAGYADQAHFSRSCRAIIGMTPAALRRRIKCVQSMATQPR